MNDHDRPASPPEPMPRGVGMHGMREAVGALVPFVRDALSRKATTEVFRDIVVMTGRRRDMRSAHEVEGPVTLFVRLSWNF